MACRLMASNQHHCWLIISEALWPSPEGNSARKIVGIKCLWNPPEANELTWWNHRQLRRLNPIKHQNARVFFFPKSDAIKWINALKLRQHICIFRAIFSRAFSFLCFIYSDYILNESLQPTTCERWIRQKLDATHAPRYYPKNIAWFIAWRGLSELRLNGNRIIQNKQEICTI